jgi:hypothetical protein
MLEHIEHEHETEAPAGLERGIEGAEMDTGPVAAVRSDEALVRLDSPHLTEAGQPVEEEAVTAADVQDAAPSPGRSMALNLPEEHRLPSAKPPMPLVEVTVDGRVLRNQRCVSTASPRTI